MVVLDIEQQVRLHVEHSNPSPSDGTDVVALSGYVVVAADVEAKSQKTTGVLRSTPAITYNRNVLAYRTKGAYTAGHHETAPALLCISQHHHE